MRLISLFVLSLVSCLSMAEDVNFTQYQREHIKSMSVVAPEWEGYTHKDGSGLYWDIIRAVYEPLGIKVKTRIVPWNRAVKMVSKYRTYNAIVGEYLSSEEPVIFPSYPIDVEFMTVLSKLPTGNDWNGLKSLSNMKVGWIKDYDVIEEKDRDFTLIEFRTLEQGLKMLNSGELDYVLDDWDEIAAAIQKYDLSQDVYIENEMPQGTDLYAAFSDDNLSRELIKIYNERIPKLVANGELAALYKKWDTGVMPDMLKNLAQQ